MKDLVLAHCNNCLGDRNHQILFADRNEWSDDDSPAHGAITWALVKCLGCDDVRLRHQHWFSEEMEADGIPITYTNFYPPSVTRQKPIWQRRFLPFSSKLFELNSLSDEIYGALGVGAYRLATMGIRGLVEKIMIDSVSDKGSFEKNISAFFAEGFVAPKQQDAFKNILIEAGHAAMHRNFKPDADAVNALLDMVEGIMRSIYYEPMLAKEVSKKIPRRP